MHTINSLLFNKLFTVAGGGHGRFAPFLAMFQDFDAYQGSSMIVTFAVVAVSILIGFGTLIPVGIFVVRLFRSSWENAKLMTTGESAQACVLRIWETGVSINDKPEIGMLIEVKPDGRPHYRAEIKSIVSILKIPQIQPGATVPVKFDRENPLKIALAL